MFVFSFLSPLSLSFSTDREEFSLMNAAFQIIQGGVIPMDIATVETSDKQTLYMTLLSSWGMIADIDIESEKLRRIGESRFILGMCVYKEPLEQIGKKHMNI